MRIIAHLYKARLDKTSKCFDTGGLFITRKKVFAKMCKIDQDMAFKLVRYPEPPYKVLQNRKAKWPKK